MKNKIIRLPEKYILFIKDIVKSFDKGAKIFIFGSRTDPFKKGGDIDIFVLSDNITWRERRKIKVELIKKFGERKIDFIVMNKQKAKNDVFARKVLEEGIEL